MKYVCESIRRRLHKAARSQTGAGGRAFADILHNRAIFRHAFCL